MNRIVIATLSAGLAFSPSLVVAQQSTTQRADQKDKDVPDQKPKTNNPDVAKQRVPTGHPGQQDADVPQEKPGTNSPDVAKQRSTSSTTKSKHKKSTASGT